MSRSSSRVRSALPVLALALLAGAPAALAQDAGEPAKQPLTGDFAKPLTRQRAHANTDAKVVMSMIEDDGHNKYSVNVEGDEVTAEVNGEAVPAERIKRTDDKIIILDEHGETLKEFTVGMPGGNNEIRIRRFGSQNQGSPRAFTFTAPDAPQAGGWTAAEPPKVMLGITMTSSDEGGINVDSVVDGLPAQAAGIKVGDRIVGLDGADVEDVASVRESLAGKEPGDDLKVDLIRDGEKKSITVKLSKFNAEKLGGTAVAPPAAMTWRLDPKSPFGGAREELEKALKMLGKNDTFKDAFRDDNARRDLNEALERALKSLESAQHNMGSGIAELLERRMVPGQGGEMFFDSNRPDMIFRVPSAPDAPRAAASETDARLDKLLKKLEKLDKRLEEIEKKLDAKN